MWQGPSPSHPFPKWPHAVFNTGGNIFIEPLLNIFTSLAEPVYCQNLQAYR